MLAEGLVALLLADTNTLALLGTPSARQTESEDNIATSGIFAGQMPKAAVLPAVVYVGIHDEGQMTMDGPDAFTIGRMQFSCYGEVYKDAKHLARAVRQAFEAFQGTLSEGTQIDSIHRVGEVDIFADAPQAYATHVDFEIQYRDMGS